MGRARPLDCGWNPRASGCRGHRVRHRAPLLSEKSSGFGGWWPSSQDTQDSSLPRLRHPAPCVRAHPREILLIPDLEVSELETGTLSPSSLCKNRIFRSVSGTFFQFPLELLGLCPHTKPLMLFHNFYDSNSIH